MDFGGPGRGQGPEEQVAGPGPVNKCMVDIHMYVRKSMRGKMQVRTLGLGSNQKSKFEPQNSKFHARQDANSNLGIWVRPEAKF